MEKYLRKFKRKWEKQILVLWAKKEVCVFFFLGCVDWHVLMTK